VKISTQPHSFNSVLIRDDPVRQNLAQKAVEHNAAQSKREYYYG